MRIGMIIFMLGLAGGMSFAQTEISGEVSGIWTSDDSPYIVVDSTWVAEGDTLILSEGTRVEFQEGQGLYVWGRFICNGTTIEAFDNAVIITASEDMEHWKGLRFYGENEIVLNYTYINNEDNSGMPDAIFYIDSGSSLTMSNCYINSDNEAIIPLNPDHTYLQNCELNFFDSHISTVYSIEVGSGTLTAERSNFGFGSSGEGYAAGFMGGPRSSCRFTNCMVGGEVRDFGLSTLEYSRFLIPPFARDISIHAGGVGGRVIGCYSEGSISYKHSNEPFRNNIVNRFAGGDTDRLEIIDCDIRVTAGIGECEDVIIRNTALSGDVSVRNLESLIIDSCYMIHQEMSNYRSFRTDAVSELNITNSVLQTYFSLPLEQNEYVVNFDHNTFIIDSTQQDLGIFSRPRSTVTFTNNIFISTEPKEYLMLFSARDSLPNFKYNCVWGFENVIAQVNFNVTEYPEIDSSNLETNPLLDWYGLVPLLTPDSPCIDAGDPEAPLDPDGTRSDIGTRAFHQWRNSIISDKKLPQSLQVMSVYPNPFNNSTKLDFTLSASENVIVSVYDIGGRKITDIINTFYSAGIHSIQWTPSELSSGMYLIQFKTASNHKTYPITLIR